MRFKSTITVLSAVAAGSALFVTGGGATAAQTDRATGGGQIMVSSEGGPGSTIAFSARETTDGAVGQVQYVDRSSGTGQAQDVRHGEVTCVDVEGKTARIAGLWREGEEGPREFYLFVQDNGEGPNGGGDIVAFTSKNSDQDPECDVANGADNAFLGRGNVQTFDGD